MPIDTNEIFGFISACTNARFLLNVQQTIRERLTVLGISPDTPKDQPFGKRLSESQQIAVTIPPNSTPNPEIEARLIQEKKDREKRNQESFAGSEFTPDENTLSVLGQTEESDKLREKVDSESTTFSWSEVIQDLARQNGIIPNQGQENQPVLQVVPPITGPPEESGEKAD